MKRAGIVRDLDEHAYHRGPELSSTGAKTLLECPARYAWQRDHRRPDKKEYDEGHLIHELVLGVGGGIRVLDHETFNTNAAKAAVAEARREHLVPVKRSQLLMASKARRAVRRHPLAGPLLTGGEAEVSLFWTDDETGVPCRARLDYLKQLPTGQWVIVDLKSTREYGAEPSAISRDAHNYGRALQAAFYLAGAVATELVPPDAAFMTVTVEKEPPHIVTASQMTDRALEYGHRQFRTALNTWRECTLTDRWPGYSDDVISLDLPEWAYRMEPAF